MTPEVGDEVVGRHDRLGEQHGGGRSHRERGPERLRDQGVRVLVVEPEAWVLLANSGPVVLEGKTVVRHLKLFLPDAPLGRDWL